MHKQNLLNFYKPITFNSLVFYTSLMTKPTKQCVMCGKYQRDAHVYTIYAGGQKRQITYKSIIQGVCHDCMRSECKWLT